MFPAIHIVIERSINILEIRQLRYFISVAEHKSFTKAANELFVVQSAVSQQIASLEEELGIKLFNRNKRFVELTEAGKVFFNEAVSLLEQAESAITKAQRAQAGLIGTLKIGFLAAPVRNFLPILINRFSKKYPEVEVTLHHLTMKELNEKIDTNDLDVVFSVSLGENLLNLNQFEIHPLYSTSTCVYMRYDHPLVEKDTIKIGDLRHEPFIMRDREEAPQWNDYVIDLCMKEDFYPKIVTQTRRIEAVMMLVDAGLGIAVFPKYLQMYKGPKIQVKAIEGEEKQLDVIAFRKLTNKNPTISLFFAELHEELTQIHDSKFMYL